MIYLEVFDMVPEPLGMQRSEGFMVMGSIGASVRQDALMTIMPNKGIIRMVFMVLYVCYV
jgi:hypothetical protein